MAESATADKSDWWVARRSDSPLSPEPIFAAAIGASAATTPMPSTIAG